eukprot:5456677-Amphidinium_carterae.2
MCFSLQRRALSTLFRGLDTLPPGLRICGSWTPLAASWPTRGQHLPKTPSLKTHESAVRFVHVHALAKRVQGRGEGVSGP